jgi:hypothetical protein
LENIKQMRTNILSVAAVKEIRTAEELSREILVALKVRRFCGGTNRVMVLPWDGNPAKANWIVNNFDSGHRLRSTCVA